MSEGIERAMVTAHIKQKNMRTMKMVQCRYRASDVDNSKLGMSGVREKGRESQSMDALLGACRREKRREKGTGEPKMQCESVMEDEIRETLTRQIVLRTDRDQGRLAMKVRKTNRRQCSDKPCRS